MDSKYAFVVGERRTGPTKAKVWIGIELGVDADGDPIVLAKTEDGKNTSEFWLGEWINEMDRVN